MSGTARDVPETAPTFTHIMLVVAAVFVATTLWLRLPLASDVAGTLVPATFLFAALEAARVSRVRLERYGLAFAGLLDRSRPLLSVLTPALKAGLRESGVALLTACILFPPYIALHRGFLAPGVPLSLPAAGPALMFFATHLVAVALPEEAFFRGYLQSALRWRLAPGAPEGIVARVPWLLQAALFALVHLPGHNHIGVLVVFFPGLVFGWLRSKRGGIGAAVVFHALCNLLGNVLAEGGAQGNL